MDWNLFCAESVEVLTDIIDYWDNHDVDIDVMADQLCDALTTLADNLVPVKTICKHSKPWINKEVAAQLKLQRNAKANGRRDEAHKIMPNIKIW